MNQNNIIVSTDNLFLELKDKSIYDLIIEHLTKYKSKHTIKAYKKDIYDFFLFKKIINPLQLAQIPFAELSKYTLEYIHSHKRTHKEQNDFILNERTLNRKAFALKKFFKFLIHNYNYPKNPLEEYVPYSIEQQTTTVPINERDLLNILHHTKEQYHKSKTQFSKLSKLQIHIIFCFLVLSLRRSEVANLEWKNINIEEEYIKVLGKGKKHKYIPLPKPVFSLLAVFSQMKKDSWYNSSFIFSPIKKWKHTNSKAINNNYIYSLVRRLCNKLGIEWTITPHSFRTAFVKKALTKGLEPISICNSTGHSSIDLIKYYDTRSKVKTNAIHNMEEWFD